MHERALQALTTLALNAANAVAIIGAGALPLLVGLMGPGTLAEVQLGAVAVLGNLAAMTGNAAPIVAAIPAVVRLLETGSPAEVQRWAASALRSLAMNTQIGATIAAAGALPATVQLLGSGSPDVQQNAAGALRNLSVNADIAARIVALDAIPALARLLEPGSPPSVREDATAALGALFAVCNADNQAAIVAIPGCVLQ